MNLKRCEQCGYTVRCCEDDCPRCGSEMIDERDVKISCAGVMGKYGIERSDNPLPAR